MLAKHILIGHLIASDEFQRLNRVSFLGAIDLLNKLKSSSVTRSYSRADHSRGVLELACKLLEEIGLSEPDEMIVIASALCHDLGHGPLSHSSERAFKKINSSLDHRVMLTRLLADAKSSVGSTLKSFGVDLDRVISVAISESKDPVSWIFHCPINIDTIDGMSRFLNSFNLSIPFDVDMTINSLAKLYFGKGYLSDFETENIDVLWMIKDGFYNSFLMSGAYAKFEESYVSYVIKLKQSVSEIDYLKDDFEMISELGVFMDIGDFYEEFRFFPPKRRYEFSIREECKLKNLNDLSRRYLRVSA